MTAFDSRVREPVGWTSRLGVADGVFYVEVADQAVAVVCNNEDDATAQRVVVLESQAVAAAALLDGRSLADVGRDVGVDPTSPDSRQILEGMRRYKALGVFTDLDAEVRPKAPDWTTPIPMAQAMTLNGHLIESSAPRPALRLGPAGSSATTGETVVITVDSTGAASISHIVVDTSHVEVNHLHARANQTLRLFAALIDAWVMPEGGANNAAITGQIELAAHLAETVSFGPIVDANQVPRYG